MVSLVLVYLAELDFSLLLVLLRVDQLLLLGRLERVRIFGDVFEVEALPVHVVDFDIA